LDLSKHGTFSHAWSLCIEEQFYLLLPLIITAFLYFKAGKKAIWLLATLFIGGFLFRFISWNNMVEPLIDEDGFGLSWYKWIYYPTYNRLDGLLVGISIAGLFRFYPSFKEKMTKHGNLLLLIGLVLLTGCYFLYEDTFSFAASIAGFPAVAIGYGFLVMAAVSPSCFLYRINSRITTAIATLSYGTYLTHKGVVHLAQQYLGKWDIAPDGTIMFLICIIICLLAALLLRYIIEKPFLKIRDRVLLQKKPVAVIEKV
jgi:peptidoglycan/LPS O-acetylase OafA/YrhL